MKKAILLLMILSALHVEAQNPMLIKDIVPGSGNPYAQKLTVFNDMVLFIADDDIVGAELWRTDGTEEGTYLIKDIYPGVYGSANLYCPGFFITDDIAFFAADDGEHGHELWRSDGTEEGTYMVKDVFPGEGAGKPEYLTATGDHVYFRATDSNGDIGVWMSDGTEEGTISLAENLWVYSNDYDHSNFFIEYDGYVYFPAGPDYMDTELWRTDGTPEGTELFIEFTDEEYEGGDPQGFHVHNGKLIFWTSNYYNNFYVSDGTVEGTYILTDNQGENVTVSDQSCFLVAENKIYFQSAYYDEGTGYPGMWVTDLTSEGTFAVAMLDFQPMQSDRRTATAIGANVVFKAFNTDGSCYGLYESTGTPQGTSSSFPCTVLHYPDYMVTFNDKVIVWATDWDDVYGFELWLYDPQFVTSVLEKENSSNVNVYPNPSNDRIIIELENSYQGNALHISNALGEIVYESKAIFPKQEISIAHLPSGLYFVTIGNEVQKFIHP